MEAIVFFEKILEQQKQAELTVRKAIGDLPERTAIHYEDLPYPPGQ